MSAAPTPIELYYWPTPNGYKITIMLEECGLPYVISPSTSARATSSSRSSWRSRPTTACRRSSIPTGPGGKPISVFESGAILQYLGRKTGKFYPADERAPRRGRAVAVLADGRPRPDGGPGPPFPQLRAGEDPVRHRPLHQRGEPALRRDEQAPRRPRISWPATTRSPTWPASAGCGCGSTRARTSPSSRTSSAGWRRCRRGRRCSAASPCWPRSGNRRWPPRHRAFRAENGAQGDCRSSNSEIQIGLSRIRLNFDPPRQENNHAFVDPPCFIACLRV